MLPPIELADRQVAALGDLRCTKRREAGRPSCGHLHHDHTGQDARVFDQPIGRIIVAVSVGSADTTSMHRSSNAASNSQKEPRLAIRERLEVAVGVNVLRHNQMRDVGSNPASATGH